MRSASPTGRPSPTLARAAAGSRCDSRGGSARTASSTPRTFRSRCSNRSIGASSARGCATCACCSARSDDPKLPPKTLHAVLIVDVYHEVTQPVEFLRNVKDSLTPQGRLGIVEFKRDGGGPGGPMEERLDEASVVKVRRGRRLQTAQPRDVPALPVPADLREVAGARLPSRLLLALQPEEAPERRAGRRRRGRPSRCRPG